ncbi:MAG: helix-turn-helix transcriptional regulator [Ruminococcus sp.]|nr:helix-turn-helix transcriptional regulator [Ruminiclostridium sp.]MBP1537913.1 helix-turn-helix transcriptional regulator [Ruminococcus sp.]
MSTIKELRAAAGMTQQKFSEYFEIPRRSIEDWDRGLHNPPDYLVKLIEYKLRNEGLLKEPENLNQS